MRLIDADKLIEDLEYDVELDERALDDTDIVGIGREYAWIDRCFKTEIIDVLRNEPTAEVEPSWIPCSERLPKQEKKSYWVCTDDGYQCQCRWTNINHFWTDLNTDWHWHIADVPQYSKVVAWMPLPSPYQEGAENDRA